MSEAAQLAKVAREHLASALKALQSSADVPEELLDAAEPIADAMSVLHRVERTDGANLEGCDLALVSVRKALEKIQQVSQNHPATEVVMEAVAASLSKVHALARYAPPPQASRPAAPAAPRPAPQPIPGPPAVQQYPVAAAPQPVMTQAVSQPLPAGPPRGAAVPAQPPALGPQGTLIQLENEKNLFAAAAAAARHPAPAQPPAQAPPQTFMPQQPVAATLPSPGASYPSNARPQQPQPAAPPAYAQPAAQPVQAQPHYAPPPQAPAYAPPPHAAAPQTSHNTATPVPATPSAGRIDVELGIHSASNFYKGLGGNDVLDAGGIFVATYKGQKIGATVNLHVLLPGDYEFNAIAVVQWTRAAGDGSEPGFGARITQIAAEGRQLVYRYARNREPMFYDDL